MPRIGSPVVLSRRSHLRRRCAAGLIALALMAGGAAAVPPPSSYNLNEFGFLSPVKDQSNLGLCWAFAGTTVYESSLLRQGVVSSPDDPAFPLSAWHLGTHNGTVMDVTYPYDGWGAGEPYAIGYWTRGRGYWETNPMTSSLTLGGGPVPVSGNPLNRYPLAAMEAKEDLGPYVPPASQPLSPFILTQAHYYSWDDETVPLADFQQSLKEGLQRYGALALYVVSPPTREEREYPVWYNEGDADANHAVTLVGWDDNITVTTYDGQTFTGAWYFQNSWGTATGTTDAFTGEGGYYWIPYADASLENGKLAYSVVTQANIHPGTGKTYAPTVIQNQYFAPFSFRDGGFSYRGFDEGTPTLAAGKQIIPSNSLLGAIGLWQAEPGTTLGLRIYDGWGGNGPEGTLLYEDPALTFNSDGPGFELFQFDTPLRITEGKPIYVVLDYGDAYRLPVMVDPLTGTNLLPELGSYHGLSWISGDGTDWSDLFQVDDFSLDPAILFMKLHRLIEDLDNLAGIDPAFDFTVDGVVHTSAAANAILGLNFEDGGELHLDGPLTVTGGLFRVPDEYALGIIKGEETLRVPGDFVMQGPGALQLEAPVEVGGDTRMEAGPLFILGDFSTGNFILPGADGRTLEVMGRLTVREDFRQVQASVRVSGIMQVAGTQYLSGNGFFEVGETGIHGATELEVADGTVHVHGHLVSAHVTLDDPQARIDFRGDATAKLGYLDLLEGSGRIGPDAVVDSYEVTLGGSFELLGRVLTSRFEITPGGLLYGTGRVEGDLVNRGLLSPGLSPGTLTITGDFIQSGSGTLIVEVESAGNHDRLLVGGEARLGGTLQVLPGARYTPEYGDRLPGVIRAGEIRGRFERIRSGAPYRWRAVAEDDRLDLYVAPESYTEVALTSNQRSVARALDHFIPETGGDRLEVSTALDRLRAEEYPAAFEAIAPGLYDSLTATGIEVAFNQTQQLGQRFRTLQLGIGGFAASGVAPLVLDEKTVHDPILVPSPENRWGLWAQGNGLFARNPAYHSNSGGFLIGGDYRWGDAFATGVYAGYQGGYTRYGEGRSTFDGARFGVYAAYGRTTGFFANAALGGGYTSYDVRRPIAFGTLERTARSTPDGGDLNALLDLGYQWEAGGWRFGPVATAQYTWLTLSSLHETGAGSLNLSLREQELHSLRTRFGGQVAYVWEWAPQRALIPQANVSWQHEFLNGSRTVDATLDGGPGFGYGTAGPRRDALSVGGGVALQLGDRWSASVFYNAEVGGGSDRAIHRLTGGVGFRW